ncbi:MAG: glycosyltransferase family 4 protein [Capsulimonadaceae bacterium]
MEHSTRLLSILQVASGFPAWGGTELHLLNLSSQLVQRGHRVTVACRPDGWVHNKAIEMGLATLDATVVRQQDWSDYKVFRDWCRSADVDVVHAHWSTDAFVPASAARAAGVPVRLMTRHSPYPFKTPIGRWIFTDVLYNRLIAISQSVATTLVRCRVPKRKITVVHHGTDIGAFEKTSLTKDAVRADLGLADDEVAVGIVGRIAQEKGHRFLFDAMKILGPDRPIRVVVVGDGPDSEWSRSYVREQGLEQRVVFSPFRSDVNNIINALDIVVVPSTWEEPCSAVVQQAMALHRPVIGTRAGGTPEMILDGETGLLVAPSDADELAGGIARLAADAGLRRRMGDAGRTRVEEFFSLSGMTDKIVEIYRHELDLVRSKRSE